jgi:hypothetical protein
MHRDSFAVQRWSLALAVFFAVMAAATACEQELHHGWWPLKVHYLRANTLSSLFQYIPVDFPIGCFVVFKPGFAHRRHYCVHPSLRHPFLRLHLNAARYSGRLGLYAFIRLGPS